MTDADYYEILGVSENASDKQIKDAYRRLAFQYHPDRNRDSESGSKMKAINEAYAVLSNRDKRSHYDSVRRQFGPAAYGRFRSAYTENDIFKGSDINRIFEEMARTFGFRGFEDIFREAYGEGYRTFEFRRPGFAARGFVFSGSPRRGLKSQAGKPSFFAGRLSRYIFKKLAGLEVPERGADVIETIELTLREADEGGPYPFFYRKKSKKFVVDLPPGLREGQRVRLAAQGENGKAGGEPGDLYLKVKIHVPLRERINDFFSFLKNRRRLRKL